MGQPRAVGLCSAERQVYPHLRGAAAIKDPSQLYTTGISPPAWGSHPFVSKFNVLGRYIPTCVGQPDGTTEPAMRARVYPHLRGAAAASRFHSVLRLGISPPAWGSRVRSLGGRGYAGYIPTCVGQPMGSVGFWVLWGVYPHLRGAARSSISNVVYNWGISPPAWGSPFHWVGGLVGDGYIPTCVGQPGICSFAYVDQ